MVGFYIYLARQTDSYVECYVAEGSSQTGWRFSSGLCSNQYWCPSADSQSQYSADHWCLHGVWERRQVISHTLVLVYDWLIQIVVI